MGNFWSQLESPTHYQRDYIQPYCTKVRGDTLFNRLDDNSICNQANCSAPIWCHPSAPHPFCRLTREEIRSDKAEYMTTNGLCIPCLRKKVCCLAPVHPSKDSSQFQTLENDLALSIHKLKDMFNFTFEDLTPSDLGSSKHNKSFNEILHQLGLIEPILPLSNNLNITLNFEIPSRRVEKDLYLPVLTYLTEILPDYQISNVSNGEGLVNRYLFETTIFSVKPQPLSSLELGFRKPRKIITLKGRSDIVCHRKEATPSSSTIFAIEIMLNKLTQVNIREAVCQLIGLNAINMINSPPVILTDLQYYCLLFYIQSEFDNVVNYTIRTENFHNFEEAIYRALELGTKPSVTTHFACPPLFDFPLQKSNVEFYDLANSDDEN